jgi:hypothetical protein
MAIQNYHRPQLTIEQILAETATAEVDRIVPIVIGPQYLLSRYGKENVYSMAFSDEGLSLAYKYYDADDALQTLDTDDYVVDLDSVRLYGENLEANLVTFLATDADFKIAGLTTPHILKIQSNLVKGAGTLHTDFLGRPVAVGDIVYCYETDVATTYKRRVVTGFKGQDVAATRGDVTNSPYNAITDTSADSAVTLDAPSGWTVTPSGTLLVNVRGGSLYGTKLCEEFTITVRTSGAPATATVDITSKSGNWAAEDVPTVDDGGTGYDITNTDAGGELAGIDINLDQGGDELVAGQVFTVRVFQAYERLADDIVGNNQTDTAGTYTGTKDTTYIITVKTGTVGNTATSAVLTITDSAGIDDPQEITITDNTTFNIGSFGVTGKIKLSGGSTVPQTGLVAGDIYTVAVTAAGESTTNFDKIILSGPAVDTTTFVNAATAIKVIFRKSFSGRILATDAADEEAWEATASAISLASELALYLSDRSSGNEWVTYADGVGTIHTSYRAVKQVPSSEDKIAIDSVTDITDLLGTIDLDNDLAFGVNEALSGVQGAKRVYALRTSGLEPINFTDALRKIEATDKVYAVVPLTTSLEIQQAVASHCESMSSKTKKNFRRAYVGTDSPGSYAVLELQSDSTNYTATVGDYNGEGNLLLTSADDVDFTALGLEAGDLVKLTATDEEYEIDEILSENEIVLVSGPDSPYGAAVPFQLWRADTASSQKDFVIARSEALSSRRCVNVWVEDGKRLVDGVLTVIPNRFVACEVAGLRCAVLPQQGLTNTEIQSVTSAAAMYVKYTQDDLDDVAAAGTLIVTQETESDSVFIRHQLTTESVGGSLYYEDSVGVNLDNISFQVKDALGSFIGKKNVTPKTIKEVELAVYNILLASTKVPVTATYGPALVSFDNPVVEVHPTLKDRISVYGKLYMPLPLNNIDVVLEADVDLTL